MKILYLMHIPWGWIKQRPHFIAEGLAKDNDVNVFYKKSLTVSESTLKEKRNEFITIKNFVSLPFDKIPIIKYLPLNWINQLILKLFIKDIKSYDVIWITSAILYNFIKPSIGKNQKVIFDCMDDELEFPTVRKNNLLKKKISKCEKELAIRADRVFFSANYLAKKVCSRVKFECDKKAIVVNNAISLPNNKLSYKSKIFESKKGGLKNCKSLLYIGTVAEWFDFDLIIKALDEHENLRLILVGPSHVEIPEHPQIWYIGSVERNEIFSIMTESDALIMPFKINELINSVNPVKLYEYIYANKPIIAPLYSESEQFNDYVYLYENQTQLLTYCHLLTSGSLYPKASFDENLAFAKRNTWENRVEIISKELRKL